MNTLTTNPTAMAMTAQQIMLERATAARRRTQVRELRAARRADRRAARRNARPQPQRAPFAAFRFRRSAC